jgi:protein TonB
MKLAVIFISLIALAIQSNAQNADSSKQVEPTPRINPNTIKEHLRLRDSVQTDYESRLKEPDIGTFAFFEVQEKAQFPGGDDSLMRFVGTKIEYPPMAMDQNIQGTVVVSFVVKSDGSVANVDVVSQHLLGYGCEEAAMRVVKLTSGMWKPATIRDKAVSMKCTLPVKFVLSSH